MIRRCAAIWKRVYVSVVVRLNARARGKLGEFRYRHCLAKVKRTNFVLLTAGRRQCFENNVRWTVTVRAYAFPRWISSVFHSGPVRGFCAPSSRMTSAQYWPKGHCWPKFGFGSREAYCDVLRRNARRNYASRSNDPSDEHCTASRWELSLVRNPNRARAWTADPVVSTNKLRGKIREP